MSTCEVCVYIQRPPSTAQNNNCEHFANLQMKLVPVTQDDLLLYKAMFCSPIHMADLGGPLPEEKVVGVLERQSNYVASDKGWVYKIIPDVDDWNEDPPVEPNDLSGTEYFQNKLNWLEGVGTICLWTGCYKDVDVTEIGWGIVPKYQGRGFATKALKLLMEKAAQDGRWGVVHCFTSIKNGPSNALAKKAGFSWVEECEIDYDEKMMMANHYVFNP